ncbi:MAG: thioredoxin family protein [Candidatus Nanopelagicales bacterium]
MTLAVTILGSGCHNCVALERLTRQAVADLGLDAQVNKVDDYVTISSYGVMSTPALVLDGDIVAVGRVPTPTVVRQLLTEAAAAHEDPEIPDERNRS